MAHLSSLSPPFYCSLASDLLSVEKASSRPKLEVRQGADGVYVPDLTEVKVTNVDEVRQLMSTRATPNRSVAATNMNEHSSRSHCCVFIRVIGTNGVERTSGRLVLIDLAGSERLNKSGVEGIALKEAQAINTSLSALGNVIASLQSKKGHIPYRDSKLTYLLSDCLSGQSKVVMFVQLSPVVSSAQETGCSLQFASRARQTDLGVAKKNKTSAGGSASAAAELAAIKKSIEFERKKVREEAAANLTRVQKQAQATLELTTNGLQNQLQHLKEQLKQAEKDRDAARSLATGSGDKGVTALHAQIRSVEKESAALRDKLAAQAAAHANILSAKEKEMRELRSQLMLPPTSRMQAWQEMSVDAHAHAHPSTAAPAGAPRLVPASGPALVVNKKKRRSGDVDSIGLDESASKRIAIEDSALVGVPTRTGSARPATAAASTSGTNRLAASQSANATVTAATARTRKQLGALRYDAHNLTPTVTVTGATSAAHAGRATRARSATAAAANATVTLTAIAIASASSDVSLPCDSASLSVDPHGGSSIGSFGSSLTASASAGVSASTSTSVTVTRAQSQAAAATVAPSSLSVTEAAIAKMQERRTKLKAERAM